MTTGKKWRHAALMLTTLLMASCWMDGGGGETSPVQINITNPGNVESIITPDFVVRINGTVESEAEVNAVSWVNDRGGRGIANGTKAWSTGNIVLQLGVNNITITATDVDGNANSKDIAIEREAANAPGSGANESPELIYSYHNDMRNSAPVRNARIRSGTVYFQLNPGSAWANRGVAQVNFSCCRGMEGPGAGEQFTITRSIASSPYKAALDIASLQSGGVRRLRASLSFRDGGEDDAITADFDLVDASSATSNARPTISGTPPRTATPGVAYSFKPNGRDADGDTLSYRISNKPGWASFDTRTGVLSGTPAAGNVGVFRDISISVSDGTASASLPAFNITVEAASSGSATLTWNPPTQRVDNSPLTNLAAYTIHYGQSSGNYSNTIRINNPGVTTYVVDNLSAGTWYFAVRAEDTNGMRSGFSPEGMKRIP